MKDLMSKFSTIKTEFKIDETEDEVKIKEYQKFNDCISQYATEYVIKKDEFIMNEALKRMPLETLKSVKDRIEQEIQARCIKNED